MMVFLVFGFVDFAAGHGTMKFPRPRNNDPDAQPVKNQHAKILMRFKKNGSSIVRTQYPQQAGICKEPAFSLPPLPLGKCISQMQTFLIDLKKPAVIGDKFFDCTRFNDCRLADSAASVYSDESGVTDYVWESVWKSDDCTGRPAKTFKFSEGACTAVREMHLKPSTPGCEGLSCLWFSQGCGIGCPACDGENFFKSPCGGKKQPTINDAKLRTFNRNGDDEHGDWTASHPWRAPGSAPVLDACGMAGGTAKNNDGAAGFAPSGQKMGDKGSMLPPKHKAVRWTENSEVEVSWTIWANHGGGYQYRLCPKSEKLTEECFQRMPLAFAGNQQKLILGNGTELEIAGTYVSTGTIPVGSTWAMNPVPACSGWDGGQCDTPQFPPPPGCDEATCWGYSNPGAGHVAQDRHALPTIVDKLKLPADIKPGEYVLGWRWDCEQTPQIWSSCADIEITKEVVLV